MATFFKTNSIIDGTLLDFGCRILQTKLQVHVYTFITCVQFQIKT